MKMKSYGLGSWSGVVRIVGEQHEGMKGKGQGEIVRMPEVMKCPTIYLKDKEGEHGQHKTQIYNSIIDERA